jgi:hypothetical protein
MVMGKGGGTKLNEGVLPGLMDSWRSNLWKCLEKVLNQRKLHPGALLRW